MDFVYSLQDVIRCYLCDTPQPSKHCDLCHVHVCNVCEEKHLSDVSKEHYIVPFEMRGSTSKCSDHSPKICKLYCEYCDVPICAECVSSTEHEQHRKSPILESLLRKKKMIQIDLEELEELIYPKYKEAASNISVHIADVKENSQKLKICLNNKAQTLHSEIDTIIEKMQSDIDDTHSKHLALIQKRENFINDRIKSISQEILRVRKLLDANDILLVSKYISINHLHKTQSIKLQATLPRFTPTKNDGYHISKQIGSLSKIERTWLPISTAFLDEPRILAEINIRGRGLYNPVSSISCQSGSEFWTCQNDNKIKLYNIKGDLVKSVKTKSTNMPHDIAVARNGDIVYTAFSDKSINLVSGSQIQTLITLRGWTPLSMCSSVSGDLLVTMKSDGFGEIKVVRYSGSTEKQSIQWDDHETI
uniref:E3 ubiquitin-protein ligase TRIM9-like isoform X2 n=1 Tax=Crassostrea virginica TaxID=6565 RepID=A0A8B8BQF0_CRAVI|nr:E3 ubiquitin-protein ligase TRIM9-like isoform X2 [Crassostrea virginica]